jgi:transcriptional regulator with XRE-family HTH domain
VQPEDVGLPRSPGRRVLGLRREEVARLAGISPEYYLRIEQGRDRHPSEQVLRSLARALRLDDSGLSYLLRISRPTVALHAVPEPETVATGVHHLLEMWAQTPAYVTNATLDVLASNRLARLVAPGHLVPGTNLLEAAFELYASTRGTTDGEGSDGERQATEGDWMGSFREHVAALRFIGDPRSRRFQEIVGRLSTRHPLFRTIWAEHDVLRPESGVRRIFIEPYGWVSFNWQTLGIPGSPSQFLTTYFGERGSHTAQVFSHLSRQVASDDVAAGRPEPPLVLRRSDGEARDERAS